MIERKILITLMIVQVILIGLGIYLITEGRLISGGFNILLNLIVGWFNLNTLKNLS